MGSKSNIEKDNFNELYEEVLKVKKGLESMLDRLSSLDYIKENYMLKDIVDLSKGIDNIILKYNFLLGEDKN